MTPRTDVEQVEAANTAFYEAMERGDFEELSSLWLTPSDLGSTRVPRPGDAGEISCVHPGWPVLTGRGEVLRSYALIMANTEYIQFFLTDVKVAVTGDTALVTCTENILSGGPAEDERRARAARRPARRRHECVPPHTRRAGRSGRTTARPCWRKATRRRTTRPPPEWVGGPYGDWNPGPRVGAATSLVAAPPAPNCPAPSPRGRALSVLAGRFEWGHGPPARGHVPARHRRQQE